MGSEQPIDPSEGEGIVSLTSLDEVGQAVTMHYPRVDAVMIGRISHFSGECGSIIHALTPGGSKIHGGRAWMRPPTPKELEKLAGFEEEALKDGCPKAYWVEQEWTGMGLFHEPVEPATPAAEFASHQANARLDAIERATESSVWGTPDEIEEKYLGLLEVLLVLGGKYTFDGARQAVRDEWAVWLDGLGLEPPISDHRDVPGTIDLLKKLRAGEPPRNPWKKTLGERLAELGGQST